MPALDDYDGREIDALLFGVKRCRYCGRDFPATSEYFGRDAHYPDGLRTSCRECTNEREREHHRMRRLRHRENGHLDRSSSTEGSPT